MLSKSIKCFIFVLFFLATHASFAGHHQQKSPYEINLDHIHEQHEKLLRGDLYDYERWQTLGTLEFLENKYLKATVQYALEYKIPLGNSRTIQDLLKLEEDYLNSIENKEEAGTDAEILVYSKRKDLHIISDSLKDLLKSVETETVLGETINAWDLVSSNISRVLLFCSTNLGIENDCFSEETRPKDSRFGHVSLSTGEAALPLIKGTNQNSWDASLAWIAGALVYHAVGIDLLFKTYNSADKSSPLWIEKDPHPLSVAILEAQKFRAQALVLKQLFERDLKEKKTHYNSSFSMTMFLRAMMALHFFEYFGEEVSDLTQAPIYEISPDFFPPPELFIDSTHAAPLAEVPEFFKEERENFLPGPRLSEREMEAWRQITKRQYKHAIGLPDGQESMEDEDRFSDDFIERPRWKPSQFVTHDPLAFALEFNTYPENPDRYTMKAMIDRAMVLGFVGSKETEVSDIALSLYNDIWVNNRPSFSELATLPEYKGIRTIANSITFPSPFLNQVGELRVLGCKEMNRLRQEKRTDQGGTVTELSREAAVNLDLSDEKNVVDSAFRVLAFINKVEDSSIGNKIPEPVCKSRTKGSDPTEIDTSELDLGPQKYKLDKEKLTALYEFAYGLRAKFLTLYPQLLSQR